MPVLSTHIDTNSDEFSANDLAMRNQVEDLHNHVEAIKIGGGEKYQTRHLERGKLLPRDRVKHLLDPGSPFLEFSQLAALSLIHI